MIDIVLATYNGERFLEEQIRSIQANAGYTKLISRLIIIDDGSTDRTVLIVKKLQQKDCKIKLINNDSGNHGAMANFAFGLAQADADFIMLSDQDDVWLPEKLQLMWQEVTKLNGYNSNEPILIFTDKQIVDEQLNLLCDSYFKLKKIPKNWHENFNQLCQQNVVSGCTTLFNRTLLNKALPIPEQAYMHDWWLALVASRCGKLHFIDKPLIQYRQHNKNTIGARYRSLTNLIVYSPQYYRDFVKSILAVCQQAEAFELFEKKHNLSKNRTISVLANILCSNKWHRIVKFYKREVTRSYFLGRVMLLISLLLIKKTKNRDNKQ